MPIGIKNVITNLTARFAQRSGATGDEVTGDIIAFPPAMPTMLVLNARAPEEQVFGDVPHVPFSHDRL